MTSLSLRATPPLGLAYIAGSLQSAGHEVKIIDAIALAPNIFTEFQGDILLHGKHDREILNLIDKDVDVIGIGCMFSNNWLANRRLINLLANTFANAKIIIGGEHATAVPEICLNQCPKLYAVCLGESEEAVVELLEAISLKKSPETVTGIAFRKDDGQLHTTERRARKRDLESIPWPAWELFPMKSYIENNFSYGVDRGRSLPIMATRGCPYTCTFCSSPNMWGTKYYMRSAIDMVNEIEFLNQKYGIQNFDFYDLTAIINKRWIIDFCKELAARNLEITWQIPAGTRSEVIDEEVSAWLYKSGCRNITYAPESGSPAVLSMIKKKVHLDRMLTSIRASHKEGLNIKLNMMIGFPDENHFHIWETVGFMIKASWAGAHDALPSIFSPYPGSELFKRLQTENRADPSQDDYWIRIIYADDYSKGITYSNYLGKRMLLMYVLLQTFAFYASNFLFRPFRFISTIKNLITKKYESRAELGFAELIKRNTQIVVRKEREILDVAA